MTKSSSKDRGNAAPARKVALSLILSITANGTPLQDALEASVDFNALDLRDRRFCRRILSLGLRYHGEAAAFLKTHLDRLPSGKNRSAGYILIMATAEMVWGDGEAHAVVDQSVRLAKDANCGHLSGLVNAVLRKIAGDVDNLRGKPPQPMLNMPKWLADSLLADWGAATDDIVLSLISQPALDLSVKADPEKWAKNLDGINLGNGSIRVRDGYVPELSGYEQGMWWVQDAAASMAVHLMGDIRGKRIADCCAAPGGKTAQLCVAGAEVTAIDISAKRLERLRQNMERLNLHPTIEQVDASQWQPPQLFDAVLIDAPCSATGTIRRHPDILNHARPPNFKALMDTQRALLGNAMHMVKPGGMVVYVTCSLLHREGEDIIVSVPPELIPMPFNPDEISTDLVAKINHHCLRFMPDALTLDTTSNMPHGNDSFFIARFSRR